MIIGIHQPNFLPWLGYFNKLIKSDVFILLDDVQFSKGSVGNRNKIKTDMGVETWMTVPLQHPKGGFSNYVDIEIDYKSNWNQKLLALFHSYYRKAPFYKDVCEMIQTIVTKEYSNLADLNIALIEVIYDKMQLETKLIRSSSLNLKVEDKNERILELCKHFNADVYLSGQGAKKYNDESLFNKNGVTIIYQQYHHPVYPQLNGSFISNLSIVDVLFNVGFESCANLLKTKVNV
jgi:hypothetical protein